MPAGARICTLCGSNLPELAPTTAPARRPAAPQSAPPVVPAGSRYCPSCRIVYGHDYTDAFCICGTELIGEAASAVAAPAPSTPAVVPPPAVRPPAEKPPAGTRCLVLYGVDRQPLQYFPVSKDATLIGRLDASAGTFPDIDLDEWLDPVNVRRISRQHALVLRSRASDALSLRPLPGNTGTQIETEMVLPMHDYPLALGVRLILGGVARFKYEVV
jgi:hypothetical protein